MANQEPYKIRVKLTRAENASFFGVTVGDVVELAYEDYVKGVVPSEMGNPPLEAAKAQAIAARTYAWPYVKKNEAISDASQTAQAYRAPRAVDKAYGRAHQGVTETQGLLLTYNRQPLSSCPYSASNGGRTVSSEERWGGVRPYLIAQDDPWDEAATQGVRKGHGVGMSQSGARYAAETLYKEYRQILAFYYPGTDLAENYNEELGPTGPQDKGNDALVKASALVQGFLQMFREKWQYVYGSAVYGKVDCSGAFTYWYRSHGSDMYHGTNTMYRKWTAERGEREDMTLVPGMALFKHRSDGSEPAQFQKDGLGNFFHVGLYIGDDQVVEAKGTDDGIVISPVTEWPYAARLINTDYDASHDSAPEPTPLQGIVHTTNPGGYLNLRAKPSASAARLAKIPDQSLLTILQTDTGTPGWYYVQYQSSIGYVDGKFVELDALPTPSVPQSPSQTPSQTPSVAWALQLIVGDDQKKTERFQSVLQELGLEIEVEPKNL